MLNKTEMEPDKRTLQQVIPLGLWELDSAGRVLHHEPEDDRGAFQRSEVIGRNFYDEVMPIAQAQEMKKQVERFLSGSTSAHSFDLDVEAEGERVRTRNLLGRISGKSKSQFMGSILLHIRTG